MRRLAAAGLLCIAACSNPAPPPSYAPVEDLIAQLQRLTGEGVHGPHHPANNAAQKDLWSRLQALPTGPGVDRILLDAAEKVYTRYDANYYHGILWHWPYLCSRRAIELCDRALQATQDPEIRRRALWLKAFALRCPPMEPWDQAQKDLETYAEQMKWSPEFEAARKIYKILAADFPGTPHGDSAARLAAQEDLSVTLPKGPKERDPREPK